MHTVFRPNPALHSACLGLYFPAGPVYETAQTLGISHLVEHLFFRLLPGLPQKQLYSDLAKLGATLRGKTGHDFMELLLTVSPENLPQACALFLKLFEPFEADESAFLREKAVVCKQISYAPFPFYQFVQAQYFRARKRALPIMGTHESVEGVTCEQACRWQRRLLGQDSVWVVATGCFPPALWRELLHRLEAVEHPNPQPLRAAAQIPRSFAARTARDDHIIPGTGDVSDVLLCFDVEPGANSYAVDLLCSILGGGDGSRLSMPLREERAWTDEIFSYLEKFGFARCLCIETSVDTADLLQSLWQIFHVLIDVREHLTEMDRLETLCFFTKNQSARLDDAARYNEDIGLFCAAKGEEPPSLAETAARYAAVSLQTLRETAQCLLRPEALSMYVTNDSRCLKRSALRAALSQCRESLFVKS